MKLLEGKVALITGGTRGIGKGIVETFAKNGAQVAFTYAGSVEKAAEIEKSLSSETKIKAYQSDASDFDAAQQLVDDVIAEFGKIDILINNAGIVTGKYFHEHTHIDIRKSLLVNAAAPMHLTLQFLPAMMKENSGAICTIASSAGLISNPKMSVYAASKWAATGWSDSLRLEMEQLGKNISVTTIMPFFINTGMFDGVKSKLLPILDPEKTAEKIMKAIEKETKLLAMPLPYWFIRFSQGVLPLRVFDWVMENIFGIYDTMKEFKGRGD